ncbi:MAG: hypothetical protein J6M30_01925 [Bacteroidales bacterium]|nr:hypothetical protein [Bacteroidales bacterium]
MKKFISKKIAAFCDLISAPCESNHEKMWFFDAKNLFFWVKKCDFFKITFAKGKIYTAHGSKKQ